MALAADIATDGCDRPLTSLSEDAPAWAREAVEQRPCELRVEVAGAELEVLTWGEGAGPGMLLVHGHGAHADWWRPIAPQLVAAAGRVVAFSFSGMGGSGWREHYSLELFAAEVAAVAKATGLLEMGRRPYLVAHSFGCLPVLIAAETPSAVISGVVLIDFYLPVPGTPAMLPSQRKRRTYATLDEAMSRFRLSPPQQSSAFLLEYAGRRTIRREGDRWTWCTDPRATLPVPHQEFRERLGALATPLFLVRGERSRLVDREVFGHVRSLAPRHTPCVEIPDADHHLLLDQPLALVAALRAMLALHHVRGGTGAI